MPIEGSRISICQVLLDVLVSCRGPSALTNISFPIPPASRCSCSTYAPQSCGEDNLGKVLERPQAPLQHDIRVELHSSVGWALATASDPLKRLTRVTDGYQNELSKPTHSARTAGALHTVY